MLSSSDVAQMFAAQNQMFMGQNQFASQIGVSNPNLSLASFGSDPRQKAFGQQGTFGGHAPVSYAPTGMGGPGYGGGTKFAGGAMSLGAGAVSGLIGLAANPIGAFMGGMGLGGGTGMAHGAANLFGANAATRGIGALAGGGLAGGALAMGATMLPAYAAQKAIGAFVGGAQQQQGIQSALGDFGFQNSNSRTGQGFSRDDAQRIGTQVRAIANIPEMMTSVEELTKLIPKLKSSGVMSGVRDAGEFNTRFKEAVKTLRDVSKVMGTTMEEASKMFEHSRSVGFLGRTDQLKNAMNVQFTAAQTGMSQQQVMQMQQGGAQMAVGRGIRRKTGVQAVTAMAQNIGLGVDSGAIGQEDIEDATGMQGEEAKGAYAQQMTDKLARFAEGSAAGRLSMMALSDFDPKTGKLIGINVKLAQRYARGEVDKNELQQRLQKLTPEQKAAATRKTGTMAMEYAGATGMGGASAFMTRTLEDAGYKSPEQQLLVMQRMGFTETEAENMKKMEGIAGGGADQERRKKVMERKRRMEADIADRTDPSKIMARMGTKIKAGVGLEAAEREGAAMFSFIGKAYDEFIDDVVGRYSISLSEKGAQRLSQSFQSQKGRDELKALFAIKSPMPSIEGKASTFGKMMGGLGMMADIATIPFGVGAYGLATGGGLETRGKEFDKSSKSFHRFISGAGKEGAGDAEEQVRYMQDQFGGGKGEEAETSAINERLQQLQEMGAGSGAAQEQTSDFIRGLGSKFRDAETEADKVKMLSEAMEAQRSQEMYDENGMSMGKVGGGRTSAIEKSMEDGSGINNMAEAAMAFAPKGTFANKVDDAEKMQRDSERRVARTTKAADAYLGTGGNGVMKQENAVVVAAAISSDYQTGITLNKAASDPKIAAILEGTSSSKTDEGAAKLSELLGRPVSEEEFKKTQEAHDAVNKELEGLTGPEREAKKQEIMGGVIAGVKARVGEGFEVARIAAKDLVKGMGKGALKNALTAFSDAHGGDVLDREKDVQVALEAQTGRYLEAKKKVAAAKPGKAREDAQKELEAIEREQGGEVTERIQRATGGVDRSLKGMKDKTVSRKELADKLRVSEESLSDYGAGGDKADIKLDSATMEKLKKTRGGLETAGLLTGTGAQETKAKDDKLQKTMSSIDTHIQKGNELQGRMMTVLAMGSGDDAKGYVEAGHQKDLKDEEAAAKKGGGTT